MNTIVATPVFLNDSTPADGAEILDNIPLESIPLYSIANYLYYISCPIVILLGSFGNIMTIIIMQRMSSGESAIKYYFTGLAITDLIVLFSGSLIDWLNINFDFQLLDVNGVLCKTLVWLYTGSGTVTCWYLVCLTLHRAMSVIWPHYVNLVCTRHTVLCVMIGITLFLAALYAHYLFGFDLVPSDNSSKYRCQMKSEDYIQFVVDVFTYMELAIYSLLPFICLVLGNCILVWRLSVSVREARNKLSQGNSEQILAREKTTNSVTLTVIVMSVTFIILTLPISINYILSYFAREYNEVTGYEYAKLHMIYTVCNLLSYCNSAVNVYLYCLTGRKFREEFFRLFHYQTTRI